MPSLKLLYALMIIFTFAAFAFVSPVLSSSDQETASSVITAAENAIVSAYEAVLGAERVGADVGDLLARLNEGARLLSEAQMGFEVGSFEEAVRLAELSSEVADEVLNETENLEIEVNSAWANRSWWFGVDSVLGVSFVLIGCLFGYPVFKRWYYRRLLKMKPKVE